MLRGIRVLDFSRYLPGPYATLRLADMGAEVVKVEPPGRGDPARALGEDLNGVGLVYLANNRGKKSVTINLREPKGQEIALELACQADVVVEGFRPGVAVALGIGYESIKLRRPDIIYCSLTGYGQTGPLRMQAGHDLNYISLSGVLSQMKDREGRPVQPGIQLADLVGGMAATEAILAALVKRERTGEGSYLDISLTDALVGLLTTHGTIHGVTGGEKGISLLSGKVISYFIYETKDGRYISLGALEEKFWQSFCRAVDRPEWVAQHMSPATEENPTFQEVKALFQAKTFAEWVLFSRQVDCCMTPVLEVGEMLQSQLVLEKGLAEDTRTNSWGPLKQVATSAGGYLGPLKARAAGNEAPLLGQHSREVLQELLRVRPGEVGEWERQGLV